MKNTVILAGILVLVLFLAGCTGTTEFPKSPGPVTPTVTAAPLPTMEAPSTGTPAVSPGTTIAIPWQPAPLQPSPAPNETLSSYILMDCTALIPGEVGSFHLYNRGPGSLLCSTMDPSYAVFGQMADGTWNRANIASYPSNRTDALILLAGDSTKPYRFVTAGWSPGHYQLVLNCDYGGQSIFHEFDVMKKPEVLVFN
jgi:hypothetical protein